MKDFISNPKNRPLVIGISAVVLVGVIVALLFETGVIGGSQTNSANSSAATPSAAGAPVVTNPGAVQTASAPVGAPAAPPTAGAPIGSPATPPAAGAPPPPGASPTSAALSKPAKTQVASAAIGRKNPFSPTYSAKALKPVPPPIQSIVPPFVVATNYLPPIGGPQPPPQVPGVPSDVILGRVSGIILSNGVRAIYEAAGSATIVQPGDELPDGNGRVQSIQSDGITIRLTDNRIIQLPVTAGFGETGAGQYGQYGGMYGGPLAGGPQLPGA